MLEKYYMQLKSILFRFDDLLLRLHIVKAFSVFHSDLLEGCRITRILGRTQAEYLAATAHRHHPIPDDTKGVASEVVWTFRVMVFVFPSN